MDHRTRRRERNQQARVRFRTLEELPVNPRAWEHEYDHGRPHLALKGQTPVERICELRITVPLSVRKTA